MSVSNLRDVFRLSGSDNGLDPKRVRWSLFCCGAFAFLWSRQAFCYVMHGIAGCNFFLRQLAPKSIKGMCVSLDWRYFVVESNTFIRRVQNERYRHRKRRQNPNVTKLKSNIAHDLVMSAGAVSCVRGLELLSLLTSNSALL